MWSGDKKVAETQSDADGRFQIPLHPGTYRVAGESSGTFPHAGDETAVVVEGQMTAVHIRFDSGIR